MAPTSFKKKVRSGKSVQIIGTHTSLHNGQLLVSTGIPSMDAVIGGGLPVGSVLMVEEDYCNQYSNAIMKYFLAEGVMTRQSIFIASTKDEEFVTQLPHPILSEEPAQTNHTKGDDLKIAWRYEQNQKIQSSMATTIKYGHYYDLSKTMDAALLTKAHIHYLNILKRQDISCKYRYATNELNKYIQANNKEIKTAVTSKIPLQILRVVVSSLGSPMWQNTEPNQTSAVQEVKRFLMSMRVLMRKSLAVCIVSVPSMRLYTEDQQDSFRHFADVVIHLESFKIGKPNPLFKDYHGMFHVKKLPVLNSILPFMPDALDLGFKMKRKKFVIEKLHLPPDIGENPTQSTEDNSSMCGGTALKSNIDF